ncbi:hypothetical protein Hdeb2414_s0002g00043521 [Helianthus debilis subsp. tardiflorus]
MGQNGFGLKWVKKGAVSVPVGTGTGRNGFRVGLVKNVFKEIVHQGAILSVSKRYWSKRHGSKWFALKRYGSKLFTV